MNKKKTLTKKIKIEDREIKIYLMYQQEGCNRFLNAFQVILLRDDFYEFLDKYKIALSRNPFGIIKTPKNIKELEQMTKENSSAVGLDWNSSAPILSSFLNKIEKSKYINNLSENKKNGVMEILNNLLRYYYPYYVFINEAKGNDYLIYDSMLNNSKISQFVVYKELLDKHFPYEPLLSKTPPIGCLNEEEMKRQRSLILVCEEDTEKEELINYIKKQWGFISSSLKRKYGGVKERQRASKHFIRDINAYNTYIDTRGITATREVNTKKKIDTRNKHITIDVIRKAVKEVSRLRKEINTEI